MGGIGKNSEGSGMTKGEAERLARLEVQQEERFAAMLDALERNNPHPLVERVEAKIDRLREEHSKLHTAWTQRLDDLEVAHRADVANLAELENKGKGAAAVLSVMFTMIGAFITAFWDTLKSIFH